MPTQTSARPLEIEVGERLLSFAGFEDFKFALAGRTDVPAAKMRALEHEPSEALLHQAADIRRVEHRLIEVLGDSFGEPLAIDRHLRELDPRLFSEDHEWRDIMVALARLGEEYADYKRLALLEYLTYLGARQDLLGHIHAQRAGGARVEEPERGSRDLSETTIFMASDVVPDPLVRLPRCVPVEVALAEGESCELRLAQYPFRLERVHGVHLVDPEGGRHPLEVGRASVGRARDNDVVLAADYRSASRRHLVIEVVDSGRVSLDDRSSHGTFVPRERLV